jgi:hypothetical protein
MVAIALPVFNGVLDRAKATKDLSNLRQNRHSHANIPQ